MNHKILTIVLIILCFFSCNIKQDKKHNIIKTIKFENISQEKCFFFHKKNNDTLFFERKISIIENNISDTILIGHSILLPKQIGLISYTKFKDRNDMALDLRYENPKSDRLCIKPYGKNKSVNGKLKIEFSF
ncbi:hypothetical protein [Olleya sp. 1-3]|uniref:hypothetical protein n=1 Tax=Olleya sp. 1-3 TaxID=2058323 RepID=UPI000C3475A7|nr:hypothetical protein [Olleya sp. 1-3]PKG52106.1 hypothetical protein CXF54_05995 [Olleya sp. 1-3]